MDVEIAVRALYMLGEAMSVRFFFKVNSVFIRHGRLDKLCIVRLIQLSLTINLNSSVEPLSRYSPVMSHLSPSYRTVIESPIFS